MRRERGEGAGAGASSEPAGLEPERPARTGGKWRGGEMSTPPAWRATGERVRAGASTLLCLLQLLHIMGLSAFSASS